MKNANQVYEENKNAVDETLFNNEIKTLGKLFPRITKYKNFPRDMQLHANVWRDTNPLHKPKNHVCIRLKNMPELKTLQNKSIPVQRLIFIYYKFPNVRKNLNAIIDLYNQLKGYDVHHKDNNPLNNNINNLQLLKSQCHKTFHSSLKALGCD